MLRVFGRVLYFRHMEEHSAFALSLTHYLSLATIIGGVFLVIWFCYLVVKRYQKEEGIVLGFLSRAVLPIGFFVSLGGLFLTLLYSEVFHYAPCDLCWFQRVFLYPQVFIFGYAWFRKDRNILPYALMLSIVGFIIAGYHHLLQVGYDIYKPCSTAIFAVDCSKPSFIEFGFVTFPFMAVVLFFFLGLLAVTAINQKGNIKL